jgi:hypothetical protein
MKFSIRQLMAAVAVVACLLGSAVWAERSGFLWWLSRSVELAVGFYPYFAVGAGVALFVSLVAAVLDRSMWRIRSLWLLLPAVVPLGSLAFGIAFRSDGSVDQALVEQRRLIVEWLTWLPLPIGLILLGCFRSISRWLVVVGVSVASFWLSFGTTIMSVMSVTNLWL